MRSRTYQQMRKAGWDQHRPVDASYAGEPNFGNWPRRLQSRRRGMRPLATLAL